MTINIRVFNTKDGVVHQYVKTGLVKEIVNNSVIASATPDRPANYNRIVSKITGYLSSYIEGTTQTIEEENVSTPRPVSMGQDRYIIRDREAGNEIDSFASLPEACDTLTEYVKQDADGETIPEDPYDRMEFFNDLIEFYEIYDTETEKPVGVHWDINDNCVVSD